MRGLLQGAPGRAALALGILLFGAQVLTAQDDTVARLLAETAAHPDQMDLRLELGNAAAAAGDLDLALASFQKVLDRLEPESRGAGDLHLRIGETWRGRPSISTRRTPSR